MATDFKHQIYYFPQNKVSPLLKLSKRDSDPENVTCYYL